MTQRNLNVAVQGYLKVHAELQNDGAGWTHLFFYICAILKWIIRSKDPSVQISCPQDRVAKVQKQLKALEQWRCSAHLSAC